MTRNGSNNVFQNSSFYTMNLQSFIPNHPVRFGLIIRLLGRGAATVSPIDEFIIFESTFEFALRRDFVRYPQHYHRTLCSPPWTILRIRKNMLATAILSVLTISFLFIVLRGQSSRISPLVVANVCPQDIMQGLRRSHRTQSKHPLT